MYISCHILPSFSNKSLIIIASYKDAVTAQRLVIQRLLNSLMVNRGI